MIKKYRRELFLIVILVATLLFQAGCTPKRKSPKRPRHNRQGIAVVKFVNATAHHQAGHFSPWEYGLSAMLTTDLEKTALFNIVDRSRLSEIIKEQKFQETDLVNRKTAVAIGRLVAAHYILTGTFMVMGEDLKMMAQVFSVEAGIQLGAVSVTGKTREFFKLEKNLFSKIADTLELVINDRTQKKIMKYVETRSVEASLKNYAGETAMLMADEMEKSGNELESARFRNNAKKAFKKALTYDPHYKRAKENLSKLAMAIPMTL